MRFMMIVKHLENQGTPPKALMDAIGKLAEKETQLGTMLGSGGLGPTAMGARVRLAQGKVTVNDGPFTETNEVVGGYAQFELKSKAAAVESAVHFMELHKQHWPGWEGETEVRQMFGPEDFGPEGCMPRHRCGFAVQNDGERPPGVHIDDSSTGWRAVDTTLSRPVAKTREWPRRHTGRLVMPSR